MGTRGLVGFVVDGTEKLRYNHYDSYPSGRGVEVLAWLHEQADLDAIRDWVRALRVVERPVDDNHPDYDTLANLDSSAHPGAMLDDGILLDDSSFASDSLFCEWAYVIDLDAERFEVYEGFQTTPHNYGRFADRYESEDHRGDKQYYPVRLVASWSLAALPDEHVFQEHADPSEGKDEDYSAFDARRQARVPYISDGTDALTVEALLELEAAEAVEEPQTLPGLAKSLQQPTPFETPALVDQMHTLMSYYDRHDADRTLEIARKVAALVYQHDAAVLDSSLPSDQAPTTKDQALGKLRDELAWAQRNVDPDESSDQDIVEAAVSIKGALNDLRNLRRAASDHLPNLDGRLDVI